MGNAVYIAFVGGALGWSLASLFCDAEEASSFPAATPDWIKNHDDECQKLMLEMKAKDIPLPSTAHVGFLAQQTGKDYSQMLRERLQEFEKLESDE